MGQEVEDRLRGSAERQRRRLMSKQEKIEHLKFFHGSGKNNDPHSHTPVNHSALLKQCPLLFYHKAKFSPV